MHDEQRQRARELLSASGISRALFAHADSLTWLTGFAPPLQLGAHLFSGGPPLLWYEDGHFTLFVVDAFADSTFPFSEQPDCSLVVHPGYSYTQPLEGPHQLKKSLSGVVAGSIHARGTVGIEARSVPFVLASVVQDSASARSEILPIDGWLEPLRMVKTHEELDKLRDNFALADIGQAAARSAVQAGKREIDIWTEAHSAIQKAAGQRVPLGNDCIVGYRETNFTGWPLNFEIDQGDSLIVDLGTGLHGYWSDGCATYFAGDPSPRQVAIHQTVMNALELATSLVRPGKKVREIDQAVRQFISRAGYPEYPHHTGHGVGASRYEAPRIVPYSEEVIEEGMVIMLEPGIYLPGETGVRLEHAVLVTSDGAVVLSRHDRSLP